MDNKTLNAWIMYHEIQHLDWIQQK